MGALCSLLARLRAHTEPLGFQLDDAFEKTASVAHNGYERKIREAAWSEADEALAQALQDIPVFMQTIAKLKDDTPGDLSDIVRRTSAAAQLVLQSVRLAGKKRQLALVSEEGSETAFDPTKYRAYVAAEPGERVKVRKAPVIRGSADTGVVVAWGEAEPI